MAKILLFGTHSIQCGISKHLARSKLFCSRAMYITEWEMEQFCNIEVVSVYKMLFQDLMYI